MIDEVHLDTVDSTQKWAKEHVETFNKHKITTIIANEQTEGIGRRGRYWYSPKGENIYATFYFYLPKETLHLQSLALVLAYSLSIVLKQKGLCPEVRWPNDVLLSEKKISGILCEAQLQNEGINVFLGIGINVNMPKLELEKIDQPATSLSEETKKHWDRAELMAELQLAFEADLKKFLKDGFFAFHDTYENLLANKDQKVILDDGKRKYTGILEGLSRDGELQLILSDTNESKAFLTGDLTLKK